VSVRVLIKNVGTERYRPVNFPAVVCGFAAR